MIAWALSRSLALTVSAWTVRAKRKVPSTAMAMIVRRSLGNEGPRTVLCRRSTGTNIPRPRRDVHAPRRASANSRAQRRGNTRMDRRSSAVKAPRKTLRPDSRSIFDPFSEDHPISGERFSARAFATSPTNIQSSRVWKSRRVNRKGGISEPIHRVHHQIAFSGHARIPAPDSPSARRNLSSMATPRRRAWGSRRPGSPSHGRR